MGQSKIKGMSKVAKAERKEKKMISTVTDFERRS